MMGAAVGDRVHAVASTVPHGTGLACPCVWRVFGVKHSSGLFRRIKGGDSRMHRERLETGALTDLVYREDWKLYIQELTASGTRILNISTRPCRVKVPLPADFAAVEGASAPRRGPQAVFVKVKHYQGCMLYSRESFFTMSQLDSTVCTTVPP